MNLFPNIEKAYSSDRLSAESAQHFAEFIAFGPVVFQVCRLMIKFGILDLLCERMMTLEEIVSRTGLSEYAVKVLMEASLSIGIVIIDTKTDNYDISKTGWFLLNDPATRINLDFIHEVNYEGFFHLEEALLNGKPEGLKHFGDWSTIYEGLSSLPEKARESWFNFDHFYSDHSFDAALDIVFSYKPTKIIDVGGNTGIWAAKCVSYNKDVTVTIVDLPQQLELMREQTKGLEGADRISGVPMDFLDQNRNLPDGLGADIIWMSQFLDCFSEEEIARILGKVKKIMTPGTRLCIMETFWDRQKYEAASFCLTMTSLYFTAMANGNSKMYHSDDMISIIESSGLEIEAIHDGIGQGHSILICKIKTK